MDNIRHKYYFKNVMWIGVTWREKIGMGYSF